MQENQASKDTLKGNPDKAGAHDARPGIFINEMHVTQLVMLCWA